MAQKFGMTWWGEQWLNALSRIDYSNRLPRGATYARKGAVLRIDAMIQQKKDLAELTVATGESWIGKLSNTELHEIFERRE